MNVTLRNVTIPQAIGPYKEQLPNDEIVIEHKGYPRLLGTTPKQHILTIKQQANSSGVEHAIDR